MAITIAVSGKGGSGKTTLAALIIKELIAHEKGAVLGVDADPNACLGLTLGVEVKGIVADLREKARSKEPSNTGMDRISTFEYGLNEVIEEARGFDLITMGRPEGPDCYCAANNMMRKFLDKLNSQYAFVVLDNEAGMEHLSRRTTNNVDLLFVIAEPSPIGRVTVKRIVDLCASLPIDIKRMGVVWNRTDKADTVDGIANLGCIPYDQALVDASMQGRTVFELDADNPSSVAVRTMLQTHLNLAGALKT
jgi:CO dehydrogenase maturation factor